MTFFLLSRDGIQVVRLALRFHGVLNLFATGTNSCPCYWLKQSCMWRKCPWGCDRHKFLTKTFWGRVYCPTAGGGAQPAGSPWFSVSLWSSQRRCHKSRPSQESLKSDDPRKRGSPHAPVISALSGSSAKQHFLQIFLLLCHGFVGPMLSFTSASAQPCFLSPPFLGIAL